MAAEVEKSDLNRIYDLITPMQKDIAEIKATIKTLPSPPSRPCSDYTALKKTVDDHIEEHKNNARDWKQSAIRGVMEVAKWAVILALGFIFGHIATGKNEAGCSNAAHNNTSVVETRK